ncbi:chemotaxis protein CheB [Patulibacter sp. S7RM1-6]
MSPSPSGAPRPAEGPSPTPDAPPPRQAQRDLVVVGASAGGIEALRELVAGLPPELPAAVLVVLHLPASSRSVLAEILDRSGPLPARAAHDGDPLRRGEILVAPTDEHLLVHDGHVRLARGPRENGHRPAVDPLFRSAARAHGRRTVAVVLSGLLDDGASGLQVVHEHGGTCVAQDPEDAQHSGMPAAAIATGIVDRVAPARELAAIVCELLDDAFPGDRRENVVQGRDGAPDRTERGETERSLVSGPATGLTCPDCGGALWETDTEPVRFVCHVGHGYSRESMVQEQGRALETTLWSALRALEERADLLRRVARRSHGRSRARLEERADEAEGHADALRRTLFTVGAHGVAGAAAAEEAS